MTIGARRVPKEEIVLTIQQIKAGGFAYELAGQDIATEITAKLASRCDLDCDDCYMFQAQDQSWRNKPRFMSRKVVDQLALRLGEYMREHKLMRMKIILHGGEPLLAGMDRIRYFVRTMRAAVPGRILVISIQTNGTQLTKKIVEELRRLRVVLAISVDGDEAGNSHRLFHNGASSHATVVRAIKLFRKDRYRGMLRRLLCVIRPENDPVVTYKFLRQFNLPLEFLRQLGHWDNPPPELGLWLHDAYNAWIAEEDAPDVRIFSQLRALTLAKIRGIELPWDQLSGMFGPWVVPGIGIEVDGSISLFDGSRVVKDGEWVTGLNIFDHSLSKGLLAMIVTAESQGVTEVPTECQTCPVVKICGGDEPVHRYKTVNGGGSYNNPSVYCKVLLGFIQDLEEAMRQEEATYGELEGVP